MCSDLVSVPMSAFPELQFSTFSLRGLGWVSLKPQADIEATAQSRGKWTALMYNIWKQTGLKGDFINFLTARDVT